MSTRRNDGLFRQLLDAAREAAENAYRPYSQFPVGAAIRVYDGGIYVGCNIECASFTGTKHAEEVAVGNAIADGVLRRAREEGVPQTKCIEVVAVYMPKGSDPWPCGGCRQFLAEFGSDVTIIGMGADGPMRRTTLARLLPHDSLREAVQTVNTKHNKARKRAR